MANAVQGHSVFQFSDDSNLLGRGTNIQVKWENSMLWTVINAQKSQMLAHFLLDPTHSV